MLPAGRTLMRFEWTRLSRRFAPFPSIAKFMGNARPCFPARLDMGWSEPNKFKISKSSRRCHDYLKDYSLGVYLLIRVVTFFLSPCAGVSRVLRPSAAQGSPYHRLLLCAYYAVSCKDDRIGEPVQSDDPVVNYTFSSETQTETGSLSPSWSQHVEDFPL